MTRTTAGKALTEPTDDGVASLWPSDEYQQYIARLRQAIGKAVYLAEIDIADTQASARLSDRPLELLAVVDFPRPDPAKRLYPHLIVLEDGRGINLGRLARISINTPFAPPEQDILYLERQLMESELFHAQRFSVERMAQTSKALLGGMLAKPIIAPPQIEAEGDEGPKIGGSAPGMRQIK